MKIFFILLISIYLNIKCNSIIKLQIITQPLRQRRKKTEPFHYIAKENIELVNISIGTPPQKIQMSLSFSSYPFYIGGSKISNSIYSENNSLSYNQLSINDTDFFHDVANRGFYSSENFIFDNINITNFPFIIATRVLGFPNIIGLNFMGDKDDNLPNLIFDLKKNNIIKNNLWSIKFYKESNYKKGLFIIGDNYNNKYLKWTKIVFGFNQWAITFDDIYFKDFKLMDYRQTSLSLDYGLIGVPEYFINYLIKNYVDDINCKKFGIEYDISFGCNKNFNISNFPPLIFYNRDFGVNFTFYYYDLFYEFEDLNYCLLTSGRNLKYNWILGKPFLKKFHFVFDLDKKLVGFYNDDDISFKINRNLIFILITIFMIGFILFLLFFIYKMIKKKRKVRLNEIEDVYQYISHD